MSFTFYRTFRRRRPQRQTCGNVYQPIQSMQCSELEGQSNVLSGHVCTETNACVDSQPQVSTSEGCTEDAASAEMQYVSAMEAESA